MQLIEIAQNKKEEINKYFSMVFRYSITNFVNHNLESQKFTFYQNTLTTQNKIIKQKQKQKKKIPKMP